MTITTAAAAVVLAGCGGEDAIDQLTDAFAETATELEEAPAASDPDEGGAAETVVDLDAEASPDGEVEQRVQGLELVSETSVFNPSNSSKHPASATGSTPTASSTCASPTGASAAARP